MVLLSVFERGGSKAGLKTAMEVPLVFEAAFKGGFENIFIGGAKEPRGVVEPQAIDEFGRSATAVFA